MAIVTHGVKLSGLAGRLNPPETKIAKVQGRLSQLVQLFDQQLANGLTQRQQKLDNLEGYLMQIRLNGCLIVDLPSLLTNKELPIKRAAAAPANAVVTIRFADGERGAVLETDASVTSTERRKPHLKKPRKKAFDDDQDVCFN